MTRTEQLLVILAEECGELTQEITKALRFGLDNTHPFEEPEKTNAHRIMREYTDLVAVKEMLQEIGALPNDDTYTTDGKKK